MLKELLTPEIRELIDQKNWRVLKEALAQWPAQHIVEFLDSVEDDKKIIIFRLLSRDLAAEVFSELGTRSQKHLLQQMSNEHIKDIFMEMTPDDRTDVFEELPASATKKFLNLLPPDERREAMKLLGYPEKSVGRLMTPDYVAIRSYWTVEQSFEHVRRFGRDAETLDTLYVVDEKWHLLDDIPLGKLILAPLKDKVESLMDRDYLAINASHDQEEAVRLMKKYNLVVLPVVDSQNILLGVITIDDVIDVYEDEVTEDIHKGASVIPFEINYSTIPVFSLFRKRIVWLLFLAVAGFLSGNVISAFQNTLGQVIILAFFVPVLLGTGGNTGTQSATLIIRAMVTGDLTPKKWFNVIKKEFFVGMLLGIFLGAVLYLWSFVWKSDGRISLIIGISAAVIAFWANLVGSILPIILRKIRLDPAIVSSPLITTITDVSGLLIYFTIAMLII
ncbi:MAG TPA: magnesium transporter [bacterium]|nr:magnesium transporter [bacterium]